jgi:hypothetical protein
MARCGVHGWTASDEIAPTAGRTATVADLVINGTPYEVGTGPNQTILDIPALRIVANEQTTKPATHASRGGGPSAGR